MEHYHQPARRLSFLTLLLLPLAAALLASALWVRPANAACSALPSNNGTATFTINIPSAATYRFWAHMFSPSSGNNAVYLQVDDAYCNITVGNNNSMPVNQFTWVDYQNGSISNKINMSLSAGNHTVKMAGFDVGVGVDKVMFASDTSCVPTGDGSNCVAAAATPTPAPTTVITPAPGATPPPNGVTPVSGTVTLPKPTQAGTTRKYYVDNKLVSNDKLDTTKLSDGEHTLKIVETDAKGNVTTKVQKLFVDNVKGWLGHMLNWLKQPVHIAILIGGLLLLAGVGRALWRFKVGGPKLLKTHAAELSIPSSGKSEPPAPV